MQTRNSKYWEKRMLYVENKLNNNTNKTVKEIKKLNKNLQMRLNKDITYWLNKFAVNNEVFTYQDAKRLLNSEELEEFKMTVKDYIRMGTENAVGYDWDKQLTNMSARVHISRLEALQVAIRQHAELFIAAEHSLIEERIIENLQESYYRHTYELFQGLNIKADLYKLDTNLVKTLINKPWTADGVEFSERIWGKYRAELVDYLDTNLKQNLILGKSPKTLVTDLSDKFGVKKSHAENLLRTETAHFQQKAQEMCFKKLEVEKYQIIATLDHRTSTICRRMDLKVFDEKDRKIGVNAPPFHCRCRTTTAPYLDDVEDVGRMMRDAKGKSVYVEKLKYEDWYKKYVETDAELLALHRGNRSFKNKKG